jgi:hypothetical protein
MLPMAILWDLQMPVSQKVGLGLVLTLSVLYGNPWSHDTHLRFMCVLTESPVHSERR